jgi:hypothetical protein
MLIFTTTLSASETVGEIEKKYSKELGVSINLVEQTESNVIIESVKSLFKPSNSTEYLKTVSDKVYAEIQKYNRSTLKEMNLSIFIVEPNNNMAAGLANVSSSHCNIYVADNNLWTRDTLTRTIHHEIFHCYDSKSQELKDWGYKYEMSDYVKKGWQQFENHNTVSVVQAGEERAEYFAAGMTGFYDLFNGNQAAYKADPEMEQKKKEMQEYIDYFTKKNESMKDDEVIKEGVVRVWSNGQIATIKIYKEYVVETEYEFDYIKGIYKVTQQDGSQKTEEI